MLQKRRTALVTGGNRGIGLAIAAGLAMKGLRVLLACRDMEAGKASAKQIGEQIRGKLVHDGAVERGAVENGAVRGDVVAVDLDLSSRTTTQRHLHRIQSEYPVIDVLVNNAGILEYGNLVEVNQGALDSSMRVNFEAPMDLIRLVLPGMNDRGYGRVVNVSSGWGSFTDGLTGPAAYSISKASLNALTLSASQAVLHSDIKVNAMCPGWVRTDMGGQGADRSPEEGADTALWLATLPDDGPSGGFFRDRRQIPW